MAGRVDGQVAFITGAARGQGRAHAVKFAEEGADIVALDICAPVHSSTFPVSTPEDLAETARLVEAQDRRALSFVVDTRDFDAVVSAVERGIAELGAIDFAISGRLPGSRAMYAADTSAR